MKVCHIHPYKAPAKGAMGAERIIESLTKGQQEIGVDVVLKIDPESKKTVAPLVTEIPDDVDILHFHQWEPHRIDYESHKKPWIVTIHGGGGVESIDWQNATRENPHVVCISNFVADKVGALTYVWNISDPNDFVYSEKKDDYFLWMAGTDWGEGKGLWTTIRLAKQFGLRLKIIGSGSDQSVIQQIKDQCTDKIEYLGALDGKKKAKVLSKAKALILLTQLPDGCPTTVSEALLSGTPVIGSEHGAMPELVNHKVGFICGDDRDFVRAVAKLRTIKPSDCRDYAMKEFSSVVGAEKYLQLYQNMLDYGTVRR